MANYQSDKSESKVDILDKEFLLRTPILDVISEKKIIRGTTKDFIKVTCPDWVTMVVFCTETKSFFMVKEYRHGVDKYITEFPSGTVEFDEAPEEIAIRELWEELGVTNDSIQRIRLLYRANPNIAFMTNEILTYLVLINKRPKGPQNLDATESLRMKEMSPKDLKLYLNFSSDRSINQLLAFNRAIDYLVSANLVKPSYDKNWNKSNKSKDSTGGE